MKSNSSSTEWTPSSSTTIAGGMSSSSSSTSSVAPSVSLSRPPPSADMGAVISATIGSIVNAYEAAFPTAATTPSDDIAVQQTASAASVNFSVYISVLMGILMAVSFFLNVGIVGTVLSSVKLRSSLLYMMFCVPAILNLFDIVVIMLLSMLCVNDDGQWTLGHILCRLNAFAQQFVLLASMLSLTLMAVERALGLLGRHLVTSRFFGLLSLIFLIVPLCFGSPLFLHGFPVSMYPFRYLCAIGSGSPIVYSIAQILVYGGCLFVLLLCFGSILKHKKAERTLPVKPQDYGAFIMESRALEEHMNLSRAVLFLTLEFLFIQGPYICLDFFMQLRNSAELIRQFGGEFLMPRDVDTLITLVKLFHPLFVPMLIFFSCADIWNRFVSLLCCRRPNFDPSMNAWNQLPDRNRSSSSTYPGPDNVLTVFATPEGLQLRIPQNQHPSQQQMTVVGVPEVRTTMKANSRRDIAEGGMSTSKGGRRRMMKVPGGKTPVKVAWD